MTKKIILKANIRKELGKKVKRLRKKNLIPAILYGHEIKSLPLTIDYLDFQRSYEKAGESTILELSIEGKEKRNVLIKDIQFDSLTDRICHVDLYQIKMSEKITAAVSLDFVGESKAVKEGGGVLVKNIDEVEVECLPANLPTEIKVDIGVLKTFDDVIKIKDIKFPKDVQVLLDGEEVVATVTPPRSEEELEELKEEVKEKVEEVEGVGKEEPELEATEQEAEAAPEKKEEKKFEETKIPKGK